MATRPAFSAFSRRIGRQAILTLGLFFVSFYLALAAGVNRGDEAWFLQVSRRVAEGERLYTDVFFGAGPLSIYLTVPLVRIFGAEVLVIKGLVAACYTLSLLFGLGVLGRLGVGGWFRFLFVVCQLAVIPTGAPALYGPLATAALLAAFYAGILLTEAEVEHAGWLAALGGVCAGLGFAAKQNVGGYTLGAILATLGSFLWVRAGRSGFRTNGPLLLVPLAVSATTVAALFLPVIAGGGLAAFIDYGLINKQTYLRLAGISYVAGIEEFYTGLVRLLATPGLGSAMRVARQSLFLVPPIVAIGLGIWCLRSKSSDRLEGSVAAVFTAASFLAIFPRADYPHLMLMMPVFLVVGTWLLATVAGKLIDSCRLGRLAVRTATIGGLFATVGLPAVMLVTGDRIVSTLPHFRGPFVRPDFEQAALRQAGQLRAVSSEDQLFLLMPQAGFYYLVAGIRNPTPFDYPLVTAFGLTGEDAVVAAIKNGHISRVCWEYWPWVLRPARLEQFVATWLRPGPKVGQCTLYLR